MRVPRVARVAAEAERDADGGAGPGDVGVDGVEAGRAEFRHVVVALGGARPRAPRPLRVELVGEVGDGEGVGRVLREPELLGEDELFAADVAPWADGVGRYVDLDNGHGCFVGRCINMYCHFSFFGLVLLGHGSLLKMMGKEILYRNRQMYY